MIAASAYILLVPVDRRELAISNTPMQNRFFSIWRHKTRCSMEIMTG